MGVRGISYIAPPLNGSCILLDKVLYSVRLESMECPCAICHLFVWQRNAANALSCCYVRANAYLFLAANSLAATALSAALGICEEAGLSPRPVCVAHLEISDKTSSNV